ncbi:MAG: MauE/DoxX family redox-associated membrane protein [Planctomycetota bacterium]
MPNEASKLTSTLSLIARILLGQVFILAAVNKLIDPGALARAIDKFDFAFASLDSSEMLVKAAAYFIPWLELLTAFALIAGLWTRAAAAIFVVLLAGFSFAIYDAAIVRGLTLDCGCFGDLKGFCDLPADGCNLIQNGVLAGLGLVALVCGGGRASADALLVPDDDLDAADEDDVDFA